MRLQEQYEKSGVKNFFMPPAFVPGPSTRAPKTSRPPALKMDAKAAQPGRQEATQAAFPLLDPAIVKSAQQAGVDNSVLTEMQRLLSAAGPSKKLKEPKTSPPKKATELSESEEDEDPGGGAGSGEAVSPTGQDPMIAALGKLTTIVETLAAEKAKKKPALDSILDGVHGHGEHVGSGGGKRSSIARRALMRALVHSPEEIYGLIEKLMEEDLRCQSRTPGLSAPAISARAWVEHRSYIGQFKTLAHASWGVSGVLDCLTAGKVEEARARTALLLLQLNQVAADRGSWQMAAVLSLEALPPFANLASHHPPDVTMGEQPFSKLLDPRWSEVAMAQLRDTEDYLEKRRKLQKGGKKEDHGSGDDRPSPKRKAKSRPSRKGENTATPDA
eukprot:g3394.t1